MQDIKEEYISLMQKNLREVGGHRYTVPSSTTYPHQWFWDSCFHTIIFTHLDIERAKDELRSLLAAQWENGMIPHMIYWEDHPSRRENWGTEKNTSCLTQPPMIAYAAERIYEQTKDKEFIMGIIDALHRYYAWLAEERSNDNILAIVHPWESGADDLAIWDEVYGLKAPTKEQIKEQKETILKLYVESGHDYRRFLEHNRFSVKSLIFNSVYARNLISMRNLCSAVNSPHLNYYEKLIPSYSISFRKYFFNKQRQLLQCRYQDIFATHQTFTLFMPLFSEMITPGQAQALVKRLTDEATFWTPYPVPSLAKDEVDFDPDRYWRGTTWININWFIIKGLQHYGFTSLADKLIEKTKELVEKSGYHEYYNPLTGAGRGPNDFMWSGLIHDL